MSIVPLVKITVCGLAQEKLPVLADLQGFGCLHLIQLRPPEEGPGLEAPGAEAREALKFLLDCPQQRRQVMDPAKFDPAQVERRALIVKERIQALEDERDFLRHRIAALKPWGDFSYPHVDDLEGYRLWFFMVPHNEMKHVRATDLIWEAVAHDNQFAYVVVISREEPKGMPVERIRTGSRRLRDLEQRLEEVEVELEDLQAVRAALTRWCRLFARSIYQLEDEAALMAASRETFDDEGLFALQAWAPVSELEHIRRYCAETGLVLESADPRPEETPPTLLRNRPALSGGQNLVQFYMTPNYWLWDPSTIVFFSFALFFAMILSDAGYAVLLGAVLLLAWKRMGRSDGGRRLRILFASVAAVSAVWGVLVGSYFGVSPASGGILSDFKLWNLNDYDAMMRLSVLIGVSHLVLANLLDAKRRAPSLEALAPLGWVTALAGAVFLAEGAAGQNGPGAGGPVAQVGMGLLAGGLLLVVLFTSTKRPFWKRLISGLLGLTKVSGAFGDVLSYLRLFALGLASASLAVAFNDLAGQVYDAVPGFKVLFASLVVLIGHGLNLALAVMSGFIHGLRLNFIEFFNWSISEEGRPFRPFARKEAPAWNP